jgi:predicted nucleic acid-binding protein
MSQSLICVDANVVLWSLVPSPLSDKAEKLLEETLANQVTIVAPTLLAYEVTSVLRRLVHLRALTPVEGEEAFETFSRIPIRLSHRKGVIPLSWRLAKQLNRPRAYDTSYLAVAQIYRLAWRLRPLALAMGIQPPLRSRLAASLIQARLKSCIR